MHSLILINIILVTAEIPSESVAMQYLAPSDAVSVMKPVRENWPTYIINQVAFHSLSLVVYYTRIEQYIILISILIYIYIKIK